MKHFTFDEAWLHVFGDKSADSVIIEYALSSDRPCTLREWIKAQIADSLEDVVEHERHVVCAELYRFRARFEEEIEGRVQKGMEPR